jgi:POT family proton-dependent oligopeptide transporter
MIADRLGQKAVLLGAIILCLGHGVLILTDTGLLHWFRVGNREGVLKPNISTMVGGLYPQGDIRRDKGFSIFYIGINTGSLLATMVIFVVVKGMACFGLAGIAMLLGCCLYLGTKIFNPCW